MYLKNILRIDTPDWMCAIRKSVFDKYKTTGERYTHNPPEIQPDAWCEMVTEWLKPEWQKKSENNTSNRKQSHVVHTTGSVPMAKYRKDELDRTGIEPSPIDCFKKFHVSKRKNGEEENWLSEKAKELYEQMDNKMATQLEEDNEVDHWGIYKEVIGGPQHGRILGLGAGFSTKDTYPSDSQNCNKRTCLQREEEQEKLKDEHEKLKEKHEELNDEVKKLTDMVYNLKDLIQNMKDNNSNTSARSRQSASVDNVDSCSDAHLEDV